MADSGPSYGFAIGHVDLVTVTVPEPASALILGMGMVVMRRRKSSIPNS